MNHDVMHTAAKPLICRQCTARGFASWHIICVCIALENFILLNRIKRGFGSNPTKPFYSTNRIKFQEKDAVEGFVDNSDDPYNRFFEELDDQHEQQLYEDEEEEDAPNTW